MRNPEVAMQRGTSKARATDCFSGSGKAAARMRNLALVSDAPGVFDPITRRLLCDWVELVGSSITYTLGMINGILRPGGFTGIDTNEANLASWRKARPDLKWLCGDARNLIAQLCKEAEVGVFNFDGYLEVGTREAGAIFWNLRPLIHRGVQLFQSFVLFSNNCLDSVWRHPNGPHGGRPSVALRMHAEMVAAALEGYAPRRSLPPLLDNDYAEKADDGSYEGPIGAYYAYAGTKDSQRMATLGLIL
jgi:hypothetical protein